MPMTDNTQEVQMSAQPAVSPPQEPRQRHFELVGGDEARGKLFVALARARAEFPAMPKDGTGRIVGRNGQSREFRYTTLETVQKSTAPALAKHGLGFSIMPCSNGEFTSLFAILGHESGAYLRSSVAFRNPRDVGGSPNAATKVWGAEMTYHLRYITKAVLGIEGDDDLDQEPIDERPPQAQKASPPPRRSRGPSRPPAETQTPPPEPHQQSLPIAQPAAQTLPASSPPPPPEQPAAQTIPASSPPPPPEQPAAQAPSTAPLIRILRGYVSALKIGGNQLRQIVSAAVGEPAEAVTKEKLAGGYTEEQYRTIIGQMHRIATANLGDEEAKQLYTNLKNQVG
jgi:hypothetical protein